MQDVKAVIEQLRSEDSDTRNRAYESLLEMGESVIPELLPLLEDSKWETRFRIVKILEQVSVNEEEMCQILESRLEKETDESVQKQIKESLEVLNEKLLEKGEQGIYYESNQFTGQQNVVVKTESDEITPAPQSEISHQFTKEQSAEFKSLSWFAMNLGILFVISGLLAFFVGLVGETIEPFIQSLFFVIFGGLNYSVGSNLRAVVEEKGKEINYLMNALFSLKIVYSLQFFVNVIAIVLMVLILLNR